MCWPKCVVAPEVVLNRQRQRVHAATHVRHTACTPHPNPARNRDHRHSRTAITRAGADPSTARLIHRALSVPVFALGFRPFYLLAAAFASVAVPAWHLRPEGPLPSGSYLAGPAWHGHEMVFGFAVAVLAGMGKMLTTSVLRLISPLRC